MKSLSCKSARSRRQEDTSLLLSEGDKSVSSVRLPVHWRNERGMRSWRSRIVFQARSGAGRCLWNHTNGAFKGQVCDYRSPEEPDRTGVRPPKQLWYHSTRRCSAEARARSAHLRVKCLRWRVMRVRKSGWVTHTCSASCVAEFKGRENEFTCTINKVASAATGPS